MKQARRDCHPAVLGNFPTKAHTSNKEPAHPGTSASMFSGRALLKLRGHLTNMIQGPWCNFIFLKLKFSPGDAPCFVSGSKSHSLEPSVTVTPREGLWSRRTYGGLSHFLCRKRAPVPHVRLHMLQVLHGLQSPSTCSGMGVLLTQSPARHH